MNNKWLYDVRVRRMILVLSIFVVICLVANPVGQMNELNFDLGQMSARENKKMNPNAIFLDTIDFVYRSADDD